MNKNELVAAIAERSGLSKKDSEKAVTAFMETVQSALAQGEKVSLVGFGTFEVRERSERSGRNPQTGEPITIPATRVPAFKAGKALRESI